MIFARNLEIGCPMKLADLTYPANLAAIQDYKIHHGYAAIEVQASTSVPNVLEVIQLCLKELQSKNCKEFYLNEIRYRYEILEDAHTWHISVLGFIPLH